MSLPRDEIHAATAIQNLEAEWLRDQAKGKKVLEVGAWVGFSAILLGQVAQLCVSVDWHKGDRWHTNADTLGDYMHNLTEHGVWPDHVVPVVARSEDALPLLREHWFDLAFVDGNHSYENVLCDARLCWGLLEPHGMLVFHDYGEFGVAQAVDEFAEEVSRHVSLGPMSLATLYKEEG